jgi:phosphate/sulfate permease
LHCNCSCLTRRRSFCWRHCSQIAIIFEFTGALVLGRVSQETISGGLADIGAFTTDPEFYAYGMMWALLVGGVWQIVASYMELNVSATHSIIGAIVGFAMTFKGRGAVIWAQEQKVCTGPLVRCSRSSSVIAAARMHR